MLNLSEEWKKAYAEYLKEDEETASRELDELYEQLNKNNEAVKHGYEVLQEYFRLYGLSEGVILEYHPDANGNLIADPGDYTAEDTKNSTALTVGNAPAGEYTKGSDGKMHKIDDEEKEDVPGVKGSFGKGRDVSPAVSTIYIPDKKEAKAIEKTNKNVMDSLKDTLRVLAANQDDKTLDLNYAPNAVYSVQTIGNMKFPQNIIFFFKQLISWIKNIVLFFIEKFKNLIRRILGDQNSITKINYDKLKLNLSKAKKLSTITTRINTDSDNNIASVYTIKADDVALLEKLTDGIILDPKDAMTKPNPEKQRIVVSLDLSRDVETLKQLMQHFFDLYDGAYGSYNEKLFASEDLEIILKIFKETIERTRTGELNRTYSLGGASAEVAAVSSDRVRENLVLTNQNITQLKSAYVSTAAKIKDISKIINSKELLALTDMGIPLKTLTSTTLGQIKPILVAIPERYKEAKKLEKDLGKMQREYQSLIQQIASLQRSVVSVSNITYDSMYARRLNDLFVAARYMSDIVTLRLSGLGLYLKELKDVSDILTALLNL